MKKTYDRKVFKRKLLSDRRTVTVTIRLFMILLLFFPLLTRAGTVDSTRVGNREVRGKVVDENKLPIPGVSVRLGGTSMGTATDVDGKFKLFVPADTATLVVSFIGMKTEVVKIPRLKAGVEQKELTIVLREEDVKLEDVVVTGIFTRKKESFTGSASTYSAAELKTMGTQNILQSLKTLDPAFAILEDNQFGSDPNRLPNMEIRGKSSMLGLRDELDADPNQPLFILDGFESTLAAINDLDINRVASITILKDAASTAIYGSKAANGVIVVETVKPEAGKLQVSYTGNMNLSMPDLSSYNLMNAREKLEFERLAGRFEPASWSTTSEVELNRFSYDDEVICGNTRPDVEGVIGSSLNWKGFSVSLNFRYQMGADVFNEALYSKVENISRSDLNKNQDKRALYERWQEEGDIVRFKNIASAETTPMSSRFVQEENVLTLESVYLGYEFYDGWIKKLGLSSLKFQVSMRDVFRASTIRSERGISYPFARSMEAGLSFNF